MHLIGRHDMASHAMGASDREFQTSQPRQSFRIGLDRSCHIVQSVWTSVLESTHLALLQTELFQDEASSIKLEDATVSQHLGVL
jgi:hypothetical protein